MRLQELAGTPSPELVRLLAPKGVLRAGINLSNFLLVTSRTPDGGPAGVSPDMARAFAQMLGVELRYVTYESPGILADAAGRDEWDIGLIGAEPQRAEVISFTPAYTEIEATYLVPAGSPLERIADVDQPGRRIAVTDRTAYGLWLDRNIRHAELVRTKTIDEASLGFPGGEARCAGWAQAKAGHGPQGDPGITDAGRTLHGRAASAWHTEAQRERGSLHVALHQGRDHLRLRGRTDRAARGRRAHSRSPRVMSSLA